MSGHPRRIVITQGEPGGCGPDLCVAMAANLDQHELKAELVYVGDPDWLCERADLLGQPLQLHQVQKKGSASPRAVGSCSVLPVSLAAKPRIGHADKACQPQVLEVLRLAAQGCLDGDFDVMVTAPVQKSALQQCEAQFRGQTEWLANFCRAPAPLMTFITERLKVALVTTHLPLSQVAAAISQETVLQRLRTFHSGLQQHFDLTTPRILVCGLNPHAGERGLLGSEEQQVIIPALQQAQAEGMQVQGPVGADVAFMPSVLAGADGLLCMYHDQALPAIKHGYADEAVNMTMGLPFVRTSPDHGTALDLAGSGQVNPTSGIQAVRLALEVL